MTIGLQNRQNLSSPSHFFASILQVRQAASGKDGRFRFKTIYPGSYPASDTWVRPPHIHFKVSKRGYVELVTQMYFPDEKLNERDILLHRKTPDERRLMIAARVGNDADIYEYDVVLQRA